MGSIYEIGPFRLNPEAGVITHSGVPAALGARGVAVLTALVKHPNEYVQKAAIMDAAWPGIFVVENNLAVQILNIRRVLAQAPGGEHWLETLQRRGYRFVGPVTELGDSQPEGVASDIPRSNLPTQMTSFVGRERELVEIKRLLPGKRLLTLVGTGGIGKTRLALQVAAEVADAYRDGVWLVELASITDPLLVPTSVAQVLGVQERASTALTNMLCAHLKSRELLLILDNCEHLLDACATLADALLRGAAEATIIATSRELLRVSGEQTYLLSALSLPDPTASAEVMSRSEAVQLFVERAQRQLPDFELTALRASTVAQLCIHLDGIPLALELAAARIRSFTVEQIYARVDDRFRLLTGGSHAAQPRQQTLRATLDWSHDLLAEAERTVLRRLSIFPGSFTLEAASSVTSDQSIDELAVIDLLSQLVERSLVVADTSAAGARYRLLETTRAYALERLDEADESDAIRRRHAEYFRDRFEHAADDWGRMRDVEWRARYVPELDNLRSALDWALGNDGDLPIGVSLAGASGSVWVALMLFEGTKWLDAALALVTANARRSDQARLWFWSGLLRHYSAPALAVTYLQRAVDLYRELGDMAALGRSLSRLGRQQALQGQCDEAAVALAEALPLLEQTGLPKVLAGYFRDLGVLNHLMGDLKGARGNFERALTLYREAGEESWATSMLIDLGDVAWALGDLDSAVVRFGEAAGLMRETPRVARNLGGHCLLNLAGVHTERRELREALAAAREGLPLVRQGGFAWLHMDHLALLAALSGNLIHAARLAGYTDAIFASKHPRQPNEARARERLNVLLCQKLAADELERLVTDGAKMSEDEACRLALQEET